MENLVQTLFISSIIQKLVEEDEMSNFLDFAREEAKKDNMFDDDLANFFDALENKYCTNIDWSKTLDILKEVTGCKVKAFKGDKFIIIENEKMSHIECGKYIDNDGKGKIHLETMNNALSHLNVKLEFIEAMNIPFDIDGFQNYCRFKVVELE